MIKHRRNFRDYDPVETAYIVYDLPKETPDFSTYTYGSEHSIILRNAGSGELEQIDFRVCGDDGEFFPNTRRLWGDIVCDDYHTILVFNFDCGKLDKITASFCGKSLSSDAYNKELEEVPCAAAATANDLYFRTRNAYKREELH